MNIRNYFITFWNTTPKRTCLLLAKKIFPKRYGEQFDALNKIPRYTTAPVQLFDKTIRVADTHSFFFMYDEIFLKEIYKFKTDSNKPYIIDCGANIGLSIIFFKRLYPDAEIVGFEPDKRIYDILEGNIKSFRYKNIQMLQKAVWNKETEISFWSEGADGGRMVEKGEIKNEVIVQTVRLRKYLEKPVDFLKIDIEGAEVDVLTDCADLLVNVKNLFVEYHSFTEKEQGLDVLLGVLQKAGFRYYIHHIGILSLHPFTKKETSVGMDMQLNIYACRF